jgi:cyclase
MKSDSTSNNFQCLPLGRFRGCRLTKRIIPCLDIKDGRTVKGINFENIRDAGDPVELAKFYSQQGADELVFLDITATIEKRKTLVDLVKKLASNINIPFTIGGGITSIENVSELLQHGADKVSVNTAAYKRPELITEIADDFGSQCVVVAIDAKREKDGEWYVYLNGGRTKTESNAIKWARDAVKRGAGEILLTSINHDGTKNGFALEIISLLTAALPVPVIASGGAGRMNHFKEVFQKAHADAALAASIFHYKEIEIPALKKYLKENNINVRI